MNWIELLLGAGILAGAALSNLLGQCAVLFLNRVPWKRFLLCLASGWLLFVGSACLWAVCVWAMGLVLGLHLPLPRCLWLVAVSHAPQLFGVLVLLPHFGSYLFQALRAWVFLNLVLAVGLATHASAGLVILCCLPGWLLHFSVTHLEILRLERFQTWLWRALS